MKQFLFFIFLTFSFQAFAQKYNSVNINFSRLFFTKSFTSFTIRQIGIEYSRYISNKNQIVFSLNRWTDKNESSSKRLYDGFYSNCSNNDYTLKSCIKEIYYREHYKMLDLSINQNVISHKKSGCLKAQLGISYTQGVNFIVDSVLVSTSPPYDNIEVFEHFQKRNYLGITPAIIYNYSFLKNKILFGTSFKSRKYFGLKDIQFEWNIHLGYNF